MIASQVLYYFEFNTRSATIIGIVGAGGIGLHLAEQIRVLEWQQVAFLMLMILVTVAIIDWCLDAAAHGRAVSRPTARAGLPLGYNSITELDAVGREPRASARIGVPSGVDVDALDHQQRPARREPSRAGVGRARRSRAVTRVSARR